MALLAAVATSFSLAEPAPTPAPAPATTPATAQSTPPAQADAPQPDPRPEPPLSAGKGRLLGEVSFSRQEPATGANIVLLREGDSGHLILGTTDVRGLFRFESIPEGTWTLGVVREGAVPMIKKSIEVKPPARAVLDVVLKKAGGRSDPPVFDLARFERGGASASSSPLIIQVMDAQMKPIPEGRISLRSRGPRVDPLRGVTDAQGMARMPAPAPGEYVLRIEVPGFLPVRIDRLVLGRTTPAVMAVLASRPLEYPASPSELLPEEKPVPPEGFPASPESKPGP